MLVTCQFEFEFEFEFGLRLQRGGMHAPLKICHNVTCQFEFGFEFEFGFVCTDRETSL